MQVVVLCDCSVIVVSQNPEPHIERYMIRQGLQPFSSAVIGGDDYIFSEIWFGGVWVNN
ncbi:MAG: hypothetical protein ABSB50_19930 [Terracidiphilus sp.]